MNKNRCVETFKPAIMLSDAKLLPRTFILIVRTLNVTPCHSMTI